MNIQTVFITVDLDLSSIKYIPNIQDDPRFTQINRLKKTKRQLIFKEDQLYRNPNFRLFQNAYMLFGDNKDRLVAVEKQTQSQNSDEIDDQLEGQGDNKVGAKQYKKKKITKVDKHHIKNNTRKNNNKSVTKQTLTTSKRQQTRKKQLQAQYKKFRISRKHLQQTGKKQPNTLNSSKSSISKTNPAKKKPKPTPGIRNNAHLNQNSLTKNKRKQKVQADFQQQQQESDHESSIEEQRSESSENLGYSNKSKSNKTRGRSSAKRHRHESSSKKKNRDVKIPQKLNYYLQRQANLQKLRQKFTRQVLNQVPGRKKQAQDIFKFIITSQNGSSTPICLNGNTGCGKTSLITKILNFITNQCHQNFSTAYLNCMSMWSVHHVYSGILYKLFGLKEKKSDQALNSLFQCSKKLSHTTKTIDKSKDLSAQIEKTKIIVLDEIDHFVKDQKFFYNLLDWAGVKDSKIVLIMISNVLDLSSKLSAKNQSRMKFEHVVFKPYSADAVQQIMKYKYPEAQKIFEDKAMKYLCRKIVSINSDIRLLEKTYEDILTQWAQLNGLVDHSQYEQEQQRGGKYDGFTELQDDNEDSVPNSQSQQHNNKKINYRQSSQLPQTPQRQKLISKILHLAKKKKISTNNVQGSLFLTGEMRNQQLPEILKQYEVLLQALHRARHKQDVSFQIMNKTYMTKNYMPSSQEVFLKMCELKDMGLVEFRENTRNCDVIFQGFGIKVSQELHMLCPED